MKKRLLTGFLAVLMVVACVVSFSSCGKDGDIFGEFGYKDIYLYRFARQDIDSARAKQIVSNNRSAMTQAYAEKHGDQALLGVNPGDTGIAAPTEEVVNLILGNYAGCTVYTKYYIDDEEDALIREDHIQGTDFKAMIEQNQFAPFSQLVAKNLILFDELIDSMEAENVEFKESGNANIAPFKDIFTYHVDDSGNMVIHTRDFAEIPSSVGGGIGCSYRQDTEILYDTENKMTKWQTSLGVYSATPEGTTKQGYILEIEVVWIEKT